MPAIAPSPPPNPQLADVTPKKPVSKGDVQQIKRDNVYLRESIVKRGLERQARVLESFVNYDWVNFYQDMLDRFRDYDLGGFSVSNVADRRWGQNFPMVRNETDLALLRMPSRILCSTNNYAIGLLTGLTSYVIGSGYDYHAAKKKGMEDECPKELIEACQLILDDFAAINCWRGGEQPGIEEEAFWRSCEDGEFLWRLFPQESGKTLLRTVEPEQLTAKPCASPMEWMFGIHTPENDAQDVRGYWIFYGLNPAGGTEVAPDEIVHLRRNVKRSIKRGMPDFAYSTYDTFILADKLRRAMGIGAAIQSSIAWVRQHEAASASDVTSFQNVIADYTQANPMTGGSDNVTRMEPGQVLDVDKGQTYVAPPTAGQNGTNHIAVLQMLLRGAGVRWNAPEWLPSADSGSANYASSLTEESPFIRTVTRNQNGFKAAFVRPFWFALEHFVRTKGGLRIYVKVGTSWVERIFTWADIKRLVDIQVEAHRPEVRNRLEEAQANAVKLEKGWKSPQTIQAEEGLDSDREAANLIAWREKQRQAMPEPQAPAPTPTTDPADRPPELAGDGGAGDPPADPVYESAGRKWMKDLVAQLQENKKKADIAADVRDLAEALLTIETYNARREGFAEKDIDNVIAAAQVGDKPDTVPAKLLPLFEAARAKRLKEAVDASGHGHKGKGEGGGQFTKGEGGGKAGGDAAPTKTADARLKAIAAKPPALSIDAAFVRDMLAQGDSPEQIAEHIAAGNSGMADFFPNYERVARRVTGLAELASDDDGMIGDKHFEDVAEETLGRMYPPDKVRKLILDKAEELKKSAKSKK